MDHDDFLSRVQRRARLASPREAERCARAVLEPLAARLTPELRGQLAARLAPGLRDALEDRAEQERFGLCEFFRRVARRDRLELGVAAERARAVVTTLREALPCGLVERLEEQLPQEWGPLLAGEGEPDEVAPVAPGLAASRAA